MSVRPLVGVVGTGAFVTVGLIPSFYDATVLPQTAKIVGLVLVFCAACTINYASVYHPLQRRTTQRHRVLMKLVIDEFVRSYRDFTCNYEDIRINVMLVARPRWPMWRRCLRMSYCLFGSFSADEQRVEYPKGLGLCGRTLAKNATHWFDRSMSHSQFMEMPKFAEEITKDIVSILSVPIYHPSDRGKIYPIGVLNVDSRQSTEYTKFDDTKVQLLAMRASAFVGVVLE